MKHYLFSTSVFAALVTLFLPFGHVGGTLDPNHGLGFFWIYIALGIGFLSFCRGKAKTFDKDMVLVSFIPLASVFIIFFFAVEGTLRTYYPYINFFGCLSLFFICLSIVDNHSRPNFPFVFLQVLNPIVCLVGVLVVFASSDFFGGNYLHFEFFNLRQEGSLSYGSLRQPNLYATALCTILMMSFWMALKFRPARSAWLLFAFVWPVIGFEIWSVGSKVAGLAISLSSIWLAVVGYLSKRHVFSTLVLLNVFGAFLVSQVLGSMPGDRDVIARVASAAGGDISTLSRLSMWKAAFLIGAESPIYGYGFDTFRYLYPEFYIRHEFAGWPFVEAAVHPHNEALYLWSSGGLVGILGILVPVLYLVVRTLGNNFGAYAVFIPAALHSNTEYPLHSSSVHLLLLFLFLLCVVLSREPARSEGQFKFPKGLAYALGLISIFMSALSLDLVKTSHMAYINSFEWSGKYTGGVSYEGYINARQDDAERHHWLYQTKAEIYDKSNLSNLALQLGLADKVKLHLPDLKFLVREYNGKKYWARLAASYNGLGMRAHLIGFLDYVAGLDPIYAQELRVYYRVTDSR